MIAETIRMSHNHVEILNVNQANSSAKITNALIQFRFVMDKISVVTIRKRVPTANDSFVLINTLNVAQLQIQQHFALKTLNDAMEFRYNFF